MIVMVFEYSVHEEYYEEYLHEAVELRPYLKKIDGFISIERFESATSPGKFVSIGYFENEEAVTAWRNTPAHRRVQAMGRKRLFSEYRLCMGDVMRDYSMSNRQQTPNDSINAHDIKEKTNV